MPAGTFFDIAGARMPTTATIDHLRGLYPQGRFEARRFRPNIVVATGPDDQGFAENGWIGHTATIGGTVRLAITAPCPRCVMITLPQGDLPKDPGILRTAARHNAVSVGVYASVLTGGSISPRRPGHSHLNLLKPPDHEAARSARERTAARGRGGDHPLPGVCGRPRPPATSLGGPAGSSQRTPRRNQLAGRHNAQSGRPAP